MNKTPKYKIGDTIYRIDNNKVVPQVITGVFTIFKTSGELKKVEDFRYCTRISAGMETYGWINESDVFSTKEELIKSL